MKLSAEARDVLETCMRQHRIEDKERREIEDLVR